MLTIGRQVTEAAGAAPGDEPAAGARARGRAAEHGRHPEAEDRLNDYPAPVLRRHAPAGDDRHGAVLQPAVLIADEPTTALDVTIQAQIVELVKRLRDELGMAIIWITHDLGIIAGLAKRVIVMYAGFIIEEAPVKELYGNPRHPYTLGLLGSLPRVDETAASPAGLDRGAAAGSAASLPPGCPFAPRCAYAMERCWKENPPLESVGPDHCKACWVDTRQGESRSDRRQHPAARCKT